MKSPHWHNAIWGNNHPLTSYFRASRVPVFWASRLHFFSIYFLRYNTRTSESQSAHCYRCSLGRVLGRETVFWAVKRLGHTFGFYIKKLGFPVVSHGFTIVSRRILGNISPALIADQLKCCRQSGNHALGALVSLRR